MPEWFQVGLPPHMTWQGNAPFWRSAVVAEARRSAPDAFTGRNLMRVFGVLHTQQGVVLDLIMVIVDVPRQRVLLAAFPSFLGGTVGAGFPMPTAEQHERMRRGERLEHGEVAVVGGDESARNSAAAAEERIAVEYGLRHLAIPGPDGDKWKVFIQEVTSQAGEFLEPDGHTLSPAGTTQVERFVRGVVLASREWVPTSDSSGHADLEIQVQRVSPVTGPSLQESLAPNSASSAPTSSTPARSGGCYVATAVYGSYDCPEVWVLRRWRDTYLTSSTIGRQFIRLYYRTSPGVVRAVGDHPWFTGVVRRSLNRFVGRLRASGYSALPYSDRQ